MKERLTQKKFGYFTDDKTLIVDAMMSMGLIEQGDGAFCRHPLTFLVEAADDICYAIIDLEDSVDMDLIDCNTAVELLVAIAGRDSRQVGKARLSHLRAIAIDRLIQECFMAFCSNLDDILCGRFDKSLIKATPMASKYAKLKDVVKEKGYNSERVLLVETAGYQVIGGLMSCFVPALFDPDSGIGGKLLQLFPQNLLVQPDSPNDRKKALSRMSTYQKILAVTDYVSGMTDSYAVNLFQTVSGMRIPD